MKKHSLDTPLKERLWQSNCVPSCWRKNHLVQRTRRIEAKNKRVHTLDCLRVVTTTVPTYTYIHYITLHYITLRYATVRYGTLRYATLRYLTLITLHTYIHFIHRYTYAYTYTYTYTYACLYANTQYKVEAEPKEHLGQRHS